MIPVHEPAPLRPRPHHAGLPPAAFGEVRPGPRPVAEADRADERRKYSHGYRTAKGTVFRAHTSEMLGFVRIEKIERVGVETGLRHRGRRPPQLRGRGVRRPQLRGRLPPQPGGPRGPGRALLRHGHRRARVPRDRAQWFGTIIPPNDNKFAALNSAVWSGGSFIYVPPGREGRHAAAGVLPHQRREHGPVRTDADHRRRGLPGALRRGVLGAGVLHRLAALGRGRAGGPAGVAGSPTRPSRTGRTTSTTS